MFSDFSELRKTTPAYVQSRAFTLRRQVTEKTSFKNIHLQGCLAKPRSQIRRKNAFPFSHPTLPLQAAFTDQNPPWCSTISCLLTQHPAQMGALIPNSIWWLHTTKHCYSIWWLHTTKHCYSCQRTARTPVTSFCYFHSTMGRSSCSSPIFMLMAESYQLQREQYSINAQQFSTELIV